MLDIIQIFYAKNYILNGLDNILYNMYSSMKTTKTLWESLDKKCKIEDIGMKKIIVGHYKMVDSKLVLNQVQEMQLVLLEIHVENVVLSECF